MKGVLIKAWKLPPANFRTSGALFAIGLLCQHQRKDGERVDSAFPRNYNSGAREFESHWPYGPAGYH